MILWLISKFEKNRTARARGSTTHPLTTLKYSYHSSGRRTEVRFVDTGVLYMVLWDVDHDLVSVAKAAHVPAAQLVPGKAIPRPG